jgi:dipeptidyl-peptidase-4
MTLSGKVSVYLSGNGWRLRAGTLCLGLGICVSASGGAAWSNSPSDLTQSYARAERFLPWNEGRYVRNGNVQPHWVGDEDRLWYMTVNAAGEKEFFIVEAASGRRTPAFDQKAIAAALFRQSHTKVYSGRLPFSSFQFSNKDTRIEFQVEGSQWTCSLRRPTCTKVPVKVAADEAMSPDGRWAAFIKDHNIWIRPIVGGAPFGLTTDGTEHYGYASSPGFSGRAVTDVRHPTRLPPQVIWSPDSRRLLTSRLDERRVKDFFLVQSVPEDGSVRAKLYTYRYALPGDDNMPLLEPLVLDVIARREVRLATAPLLVSIENLYGPHNMWWSAQGDQIYFLNRDRSSRSITLESADPGTGTVTDVLRESSDTWIRISNKSNPFVDDPAVRILRNGDVIWYSERSGWGHLYYYDGATRSLRNQITRGDWVVRSIVRIDETANRIYFSASGREAGQDPYEQNLYVINFDGTDLRLLTPEPADHESASAESAPSQSRFSHSGRYFFDRYSRPDMPPTVVLRSTEGRLITRLAQADISELRQEGYSAIEPFQVLAADGKTAIYGNLFRPSDLDATRKYRVIDAVYPGPQTLRTRKTFLAATFDAFEAQSLAELGFIVVTIDGRGTPNRSKAFLDYSYGQLDKASDLEDHIAGIRQLADRYRYMDIDEVGVDGASAGGYAAARAILGYPDFYKVAVSAEGDHDPRGYLAPWAQTYDGSRQASDYRGASNLPLAVSLKGKLLLMHGEMDDNVSPSLTIKLVNALVKANKDFDLLIIPNGNHQVWTSPYFIRRKWDYFVSHLQGAVPPADYVINLPPAIINDAQ